MPLVNIERKDCDYRKPHPGADYCKYKDSQVYCYEENHCPRDKQGEFTIAVDTIKFYAVGNHFGTVGRDTGLLDDGYTARVALKQISS